jgi:hypothetical protein
MTDAFGVINAPDFLGISAAFGVNDRSGCLVMRDCFVLSKMSAPR